MKLSNKLVVWLLLISLLSLACGLTDAVTEQLDEVQTTLETTPTEEITTEETQPEVEEPSPGAMEEGEQMEQAPAEPEAAEGEEAGDLEESTLELDAVSQTLQNLSSYRTNIILSFDGTDSEGQTSQGKIEILLERTTDPEATHLVMQMEGTTMADMGGAGSLEVYAVEDTMYMQIPESGEWISFPRTGEEDEILSQGFFSPDDLIDFPQTARRSPEPETVNGIETWHYTFNEEDVANPGVPLESATGDLWVAREGGYPVKYNIEATGSNPEPEMGELFVSGTFQITYELLEANTDFTIAPPEEALNSAGLEDLFGGGMEEPAEIDLPMMEDAEVEFAVEGLVSYYTQASVEEAVTFYRQELPAQGWTADSSTEFVGEDSALLSFTKEGAELSVSITLEEDGRVNVSLISTE